MTNELGRELTTAEAIAIATGQMTIMDIVHGVALELDSKRDSEVHTVMPSGTVITRGELWREMHRPPLTPNLGGKAGAYFPGWHGIAEVV
jgi:hypothetical protein